MWKPNTVVPEHRWRARIVWASLLVSITAYTVWEAWKMHDGYSNPSTSLEVTNETYDFPYVLVCFFEGEGCGFGDDFDSCVEDALERSSVIDHNFVERTDVVVASRFDNCLGFDLTMITVVDDEVPQDRARVNIDMEWTVTDAASAEMNFYNRIQVYIATEEPTESELNFLPVPYTRWIPDDELTLPLTLAELTIGKTTKESLGGDITTTFPPLILSSTVLESENPLAADPTADVAYGQMNIVLAQGPFSRTSVKELSPLDLGGFFGNVGGFWELLLVLWGLFFIATRNEDTPMLKPRKFVEPVKEIIRRRSLSVDSGTPAAPQAEERLHWEAAYGGKGNRSSAPPPLPPRSGVTAAGGTAAAAGFPVMPPVNDGSRDHRRNSPSASSRRPVVQDAPRRGSMSGGRPSASQEPMPPSYFDMTRAP